MKNSFKKKFLVLFLILAMILTFSFAPAQRAYAGDLFDFIFIANLLTGGLFIVFNWPGIALCIVGIGPSGLCNGGGNDGMPIILPTIIPGTCQIGIPLTFYIPSFNSGNTRSICYDDGHAVGTIEGDSVWVGGEHCGISSSQLYRAPKSGEPGYVAPLPDPWIPIIMEDIFNIKKAFAEASAPAYNCLIQDSQGGNYIKTSDGGCFKSYSVAVPSAIDETHNKIAIYRFSWPISKFESTPGDINTINYQYFGMSFFSTGVGSGYGSGGAFGTQLGGGWLVGMYNGLYFNMGSQYGISEASPLAVLDYSQICTGNVCKVEDGNNVPQNSYVFYAAKILGNYTYPVYPDIDIPGPILGDIFSIKKAFASVPTYTVTTLPNKFLGADNSPSGVGMPSLYKDSYSLGNVYLGPYKTEVPDQSKCTKVDGVCAITHYNCTAGTSSSNVEGTNSYTWSCTGSSGGTTASCSESKTTTPTATLSQSVNITTSDGTTGQSFTLSWGSANVTSCSMSRITTPLNGASGAPQTVPCYESKINNYSGTSLNGSCSANPSVVGTTVFTFSCTGSGGPASASVTHTVMQAACPNGANNSPDCNACTTPLVWNSSSNSCVSLSGTLTASNCTITTGNSSCNTTLTWTTTNPVGTSNITSNTPNPNTVVATGNSGTVSASVPYNTRSFFLNNNAVTLVSATATANCASGAVWNGSICSPVPTTCTLPWGGNIASGNSVTAYQLPSVTYPAACTSETRNCNNGTLSGSYTNQSCTVIGVDGVCAATHYNCANGTSINNKNSPSRWTWTCAGLHNGASVQCFQRKGPGVIEN